LRAVLEVSPNFDYEIPPIECETELFMKEMVEIWILVAKNYNVEELIRCGYVEKMVSWCESCSVELWMLCVKCFCVMCLNGGEMVVAKVMEFGFSGVLLKCFECENLEFVELVLRAFLRVLRSLKGKEFEVELRENVEFVRRLEELTENYELASVVLEHFR
jgi:hypothetical protein